jgi:hypothetical protein
MKLNPVLSLALFALTAFSSRPVFAQTADGSAPKPETATTAGGAVPRTADGKPDFSGVWDHPYVPDMAKTTKNGPLMSQEGPGKLPFTPAAQAEFDKYDPHTDGDYTGACLPFGYLRSFNAPYPIEIMQTPKKIAFLFEQNTWFHIAALDRNHPKDVYPTWFGDSVARWDGDTLVIDTIGFNGKTRLDTIGHQHSDAMHVVQRLTRLDGQRLKMEITVDDPKTYTEPWKNTRVFALMKPGSELMEYSCEENNRDYTQGHIKRPAGE